MNNLKNLPKEVQNLVIAAYEIGYWDREAKLPSFNGETERKNKLEYIDDVLFGQEEEVDVDLIDSVS